MFTRKMAFAISLGCIFGSLIAYLAGFDTLWCTIGAVAGGAVAWLFFGWGAIFYHAPRIWRNLSGRGLPDDFAVQFGRSCVIGFRMWVALASVLLVVVCNGVIGLAATSIWHPYEAMVALVVTSVIVAGVLSVILVVLLGVALSTSARGMMYSAEYASEMKSTGEALNICSPAVLFWSEVRLVSLLVRFGLKLFADVHSNDALACFGYTVAGVGIAAFGIHDARAIPASVIVGLGLAFVGSFLSRKLVVPYLAAHP